LEFNNQDADFENDGWQEWNLRPQAVRDYRGANSFKKERVRRGRHMSDTEKELPEGYDADPVIGPPLSEEQESFASLLGRLLARKWQVEWERVTGKHKQPDGPSRSVERS
jgi:hypothetical protein